MYLDHRLTARIARVLNMVDPAALLLDATGSVILPVGDMRTFTLPDEALANPTVPYIYGALTLIGTSDEQPVFVCLHGTSEDVKKCALVCAELINMLMRQDLGHGSREQALRQILLGDADGAELESMASEHGIPMHMDRCVLYIYFQDMEVETAIRMMSDTLDEQGDLITEVGHQAVAMLKAVGQEDDYTELLEYANAIESSFLAEAGVSVYIGISDVREELADIPLAYAEAKNAINVGRVYHPNKHVFAYRNLLLERFLNQVPADMGTAYNGMIFNRKTARLFTDEMIHTIETFFDNSLNLSETARKLYIHRNTLVYRLEKVQHAIGLDLRNFDDAVTFKMMMLLGKGEGSRRLRA
ncbi:MAG: helix-turn-helix domain-containing protein [Clostridia bacterium]|nr:helix-turn-helix domain-containing protein [Clostridia bacterium]